MNSRERAKPPLGGWKQGIAGCLREAAESESGANLVELALLLPLMILMFLGVAEVGSIFYMSIEVNNAALAGAAYGAQSNITAADTAGMARVAQQDASNVPGLTASATYYCACSTTAGALTNLASCSSTCTAGSHEVIFVKVNTSATFSALSKFPALPNPFTTSGQAIMRVSQ